MTDRSVIFLNRRVASPLLTKNKSSLSVSNHYDNDIGHTYELRSAYRNETNEGNKSTDNNLPTVPSTTQNRTKLTHTVLARQRYNVGERATAAISTAVLIDYKIITKNDTTQPIDKSKVARETERVRIENASCIDFSNLTGLYFDGRRDKTK